MPFRSSAQRRYLFAREPEVAREFASHTPKGAHLPEHVSEDEDEHKKKRRTARAAIDKLGKAPS